MSPNPGPPIALTMGEPGGVGPEITIKAYEALRVSGPAFFAIADPAVYARAPFPVSAISAPSDAGRAFVRALPVIDLEMPVSATAGKAAAASAPCVIASIERAVGYALSGGAAAVVTNPIQKASLIAGGFRFPGHTEFLESLTAGTPMPQGRRFGSVMMIAGPALRSVPLTIHLPVRKAIEALTTEMIVDKSMIVVEALKQDFGIGAPRLAISGLNPHAGEGGAIGTEDRDIIVPAIERLRRLGVSVVGPLPADTMFHAEARKSYDAALCMLHDQALIPAKTLAFHDAVNVTLGLPIIRTSPDHGTALDIAGKGTADPSSLIAAIRLAASMAATRRAAQ